MIAFSGKEGESTPFISIHKLDKDFDLLGSDDNLINLVSLYNSTHSRMQVEMNDNKMFNKMQKMVANLKFGYLTFEQDKECIYNILFLPFSKNRVLVATDYKSSVIFLELQSNNSLSKISDIKLHLGKLCSLLIYNYCYLHSPVRITYP